MRRILPFAAAVALALPLAAAAGPKPPPTSSPLEEQVRQRVRRFPGVIGVFAKDLQGDHAVAYNADVRFPTASLIKVAVMVETFHQISEGKLARDTIRTLQESDKVGDEPVVLNAMHAGMPLTVSDLLDLMIAFSDNTATNMLVGLVGTANVDRRMDSYHLGNTRLFRPTFRDGHADVLPELEREFGLGMTTPREAARLMELIAEGKVVGRPACDEMLAMLERQQDRTLIPRSLPFEKEKIVVANKSGWDEEKLPDAGFKGEIHTDAAFVKGPRAQYVVAILTRRVRDKRPGPDNEALVTGAAISRMIYDAFSGVRHKP
jgi:beta-lactamase class A